MPLQHHHASSHSRSFLVLVSVGAIGIAGCATKAIDTAGPSVAAEAAPQARTIGGILKSDPRFTDFVQVIGLAGLGHRLNNDRDVTVFAPTNAAFQHAEPNWRATEVPSTNTGGWVWTQKRQALVEQSFLDGVHPPAEFAGQTQDVRARNGTVFHVDGRQPGVLSITTGPTTTGMGYARRSPQTATVDVPPIVTRDGIIYPVDDILVR